MRNNIVAVIQARVGSTRLPAKVLLDLEGKTVLEHVIERVKKSRFAEEVVVATTILKEDLKIVNLCSSAGIRVFCGSADDVLDRYFQVARLLQAQNVIRITADCPLLDPNVIDKVVRLHLSKKADYTSNTLKETFPDGQDVEVFTYLALQKAWQRARLSSEREHVTAYIKNHPNLFRLVKLDCSEDFSQKRWTLDEKQDYEFIKLIYANLYRKNRVFGMSEVIEFLKRHPEYEAINCKIRRNEGYIRSLKKNKILDSKYLEQVK